MLDKLAGIETRYEEINHLLMEVGNDYQRVAELSRERTDLEPLVEKTRQYRQALTQLDEARTIANGDEAEIRELAVLEISELEQKTAQLETEIKGLLLPKDPREFAM